MGKSWKIGRVAGIDLLLHPTFLILAVWALFAWGLSSTLLLAAVFGCVVLHELGHALTARLYGIATEDITLTPIGGIARLERMPRAPGAELLITLAGPMVNVAIASGLAAGISVANHLGRPGSGFPAVPRVRLGRDDDQRCPGGVQHAPGVPDGRRKSLPGGALGVRGTPPRHRGRRRVRSGWRRSPWVPSGSSEAT